MSNTVQDAVKDKYGAVARSTLSSKHEGVRAVAEAFGYSAAELSSIPAEANMGLSCGNPTAFASLRPGEVVVDLGCGGGLDVFLAAGKVGPTGRAIGIDMTESMICRARESAATAGPNRTPLTNVEFHLSTIDRLPLADGSVDCVISNCVINLAPDKGAVFREIARVLKPTGRLAVSDIALKKALPPALAQDIMAYVGCIAGAISMEEYRAGLKEAGFSQAEVMDSGADLNAYAKVENQAGCCSPVMEAPTSSSCCTPVSITSKSLPIAGASGCCSGENKSEEAKEESVHGGLAELLKQYDINEYAASVKVYAVKG